MTHHYYICRGSVPTKVQILCHFLKSIRLKNHICQLVILPIMCPVGLHLSDRGAAAWCGFTICPVGLHLSDRGAAAWYGFTIYPVGLRLLILWLLPGMASPFALWGKLKGATPVLKELRPPGIIEPYKTYFVKQTLLKRGAILSDCTPRNNEMIN